jgi:very-short-patch-repair endonuclease
MIGDKMHRNAKPDLFKLAGQSRKVSTEAEKILWERLRGRRLNGFKFRRQHPIAEFIVDFICVEFGLAIEVDGEYHDSDKQRMLDEQRTVELNKLNIKVIRFTNHEVIHQTNLVLNKIEQLLTTH